MGNCSKSIAVLGGVVACERRPNHEGAHWGSPPRGISYGASQWAVQWHDGAAPTLRTWKDINEDPIEALPTIQHAALLLDRYVEAIRIETLYPNGNPPNPDSQQIRVAIDELLKGNKT